MSIREYEAEHDQEAVTRIWFEIGWLENEAEARFLGDFIEAGRAFIADVEGGAECLALSMPGSMRFQSEELRLSAMMAVTTSRIARKAGARRSNDGPSAGRRCTGGFRDRGAGDVRAGLL